MGSDPLLMTVSWIRVYIYLGVISSKGEKKGPKFGKFGRFSRHYWDIDVRDGQKIENLGVTLT